MNREPLVKPVFFFGDKISNSDKILFEEEGKWLRHVGDLLMFLPDMEWSYPLVYLQLDWDPTREHDGVVVGKFCAHGPYQDGPGRCVTGHLPERVTKDHPVGEILIWAKTFISELVGKGK